jgi:hypothetical protein
MTSLNRAAARRRRHGDTRTLDQLRADIALARLLPRTRRSTISNADDPVEAPQPANSPNDRMPDDQTPEDRTADTGAADERTAGTGPTGDMGGHDADATDDTIDDADIGADATVIIHATGAELQALISGEEGTGGEAEHHGPIPQNSLRKHLVRALTRTLLAEQGMPVGMSTATTSPVAHTTRGKVRRAVAARDHGRSRIDVRITDQPPPGIPDSYTPTAAVDRFVRLRDRTCQFPGCNQPAEFADLDHRTAFAEGGRTTTHNLHCLCRHHHRLKHQGGWSITPNPDGTVTWTSPTGRCYRTPSPEPDP